VRSSSLDVDVLCQQRQRVSNSSLHHCAFVDFHYSTCNPNVSSSNDVLMTSTSALFRRPSGPVNWFSACIWSNVLAGARWILYVSTKIRTVHRFVASILIGLCQTVQKTVM